MTMRDLPKTCEHGHPTKSAGFYSLQDNEFDKSKPIEWDQDSPNYNAPMVFYIPECKDASKSLKAHIVDPDWPENVDRYSEQEISRGAGTRKPRADRGVKRGPRKAA